MHALAAAATNASDRSVEKRTRLLAGRTYMELEHSWSRKKMELEHSTAAGLSVLLRPRVGGSVAARGGRTAVAAAGSEQTAILAPPSSSSVLSAAVREMLAASRLNNAGKRPRGPCHPPGRGNDAGAESQGSCATNAEVAPAGARTRQAPAKRVARHMLRRRGGTSPPAPDHGGTKVLKTCCCERLPPGLPCALHQRVAVAPRAACGRGGGWAFGEYARWRRSVSAAAPARRSGLRHRPRCWSSGPRQAPAA